MTLIIKFYLDYSKLFMKQGIRDCYRKKELLYYCGRVTGYRFNDDIDPDGDSCDTGALRGVAPGMLSVSSVLLLPAFLAAVLPTLPSCFLACPNSVLLQREAKFKEQIVSPTLYTAGLIFTKVSTFEFPPNESYSEGYLTECYIP